ncbi:FAD-dependent oxidoreductase [Paenibacillus spongiae]|uniref:FAD-dependent oxidoreductase n=1 Tax=Paenibacillus spongiae TaxID=2909671 RepID=A0ABY5S0B8_9BACL|nr:FAD-dependent oxidoreductase [Paenibacillus spongiae]UVI27271.1 FAD-dependent oxidoreductase [Paenibacillus spongiae]
MRVPLSTLCLVAFSGARCGKKVVLLEHSGQLGGKGTLGNVIIFFGVGIVTRIYRELVSEVMPYYLPQSHQGKGIRLQG